MEEARLKDSISYNFIVQMVPHHLAAIEMSENLLAYCPIPALKEIAEGIITEQTRGIGDMLEIEEECEACRNTPCQLNKFQGRINQIKQLMFFQMRHACADNNISCNFMRCACRKLPWNMKFVQGLCRYCSPLSLPRSMVLCRCGS